MAANVKQAETAWERVVELTRSEAARRSEPPRASAAQDDAADRWLAFNKTQFLSAWRHVSSMHSGSDIRDDYALFLMTPQQATVRKTLEALAVDVTGLLAIMQSDDARRTFKEQISGIEGVLVACLGHPTARPRAQAVRLLNSLYDGVDWQLQAPLEPAVSFVGKELSIDIYTTTDLSSSASISGGSSFVGLQTAGDPEGAYATGGAAEAFRVLVSAPPYDTGSSGQSGPAAVLAGAGVGLAGFQQQRLAAEQLRVGAPETILSMHTPQISREEVWVRAVSTSGDGSGTPGAAAASGSSGGSVPAAAAGLASGVNAAVASERFVKVTATRIRLKLAPFTRCGFFDWRVVVVCGDGSTRPVTAVQPLSSHEVAVAVADGLLPASALQSVAGTGGGPLPGMSPLTMSMPTPSPQVGTPAFSALPATAAASAAGAGGPVPISGLAQGRYIVQRAGLAEEHWHEVIIDLEGMKFSDDGNIVKHGTFADVSAKLRTLRQWGVTSLYTLGAIERDNAWGEREPDASAVTSPRGQGAGQGGSGVGPGAGQVHVPGSEYRPVTGTSSGYLPHGHGMSNDDAQSEGGSGFGFIDIAGGSNGNGAMGSELLMHQQQGGQQNITFGTITGNMPLLQTGDHQSQGQGGFGYPQAGDLSIQAPASSVPGSDGLPAGHREYAMRPDSNPHAVVDRITPNRMLGGHLGFARMVREAATVGMRVVVQVDASVSASRPHRKYRHLYAKTLDINGQAVVHAGTDGLENQWEDQQLLNYRKVETWDLLVSEAKTLVQNFGVGGLYLSDAQSYPFIMAIDTGELFRRDVDGETHYSPREMLEGEVVVANSEVGYWSTHAAKSYPNPLLVKLVRALWHVAPDFTVVGESHWGRAGALARSGVIPHGLDLVTAIAATLGRVVDKNGVVRSVSLPHGVEPIHMLRALVAGEPEGLVPPQAAPQFRAYQDRNGYPNPLSNMLLGPGGPLPLGAQQLQLRSLSSSRLPYPALLLGRSAWTGADLLYTLPGVPFTFQDERLGRAFRIDVTGTYRYNESYIEEERKKKERRLRAEKHNKRWMATQGGTGGSGGGMPGSGSGSGSRASKQSLVSGAQPEALQGGNGGSIIPSSSPVHDQDRYDGHIGAGGVVPAPRAARGGQVGDLRAAQMRTGFSHMDLQELAATAQGFATGLPMTLLQPDRDGRGASMFDQFVLGLDAADSAAAPQPRAALPPHLQPQHQQQLESSSWEGRASNQHIRSISSSPALQNLLMGSGSGEGLSDEAGPLAAPAAAAGDIHHRHVFDGEAENEEAEESEGNEEPAPLGGRPGGGFGFGGSPAAAASGSTSGRAGRGTFPSYSVHRRGGSSSTRSGGIHPGSAAPMSKVLQAAGRDDIPRIQSWQAMDAMRLMGGEGGGSGVSGRALQDSIKSMQAMEDRLRAEVGPEYGFDLQQIAGHYEHRRQCRMRYRVLRDGDMTMLTARHRFGEHGHVFTFARHLPGQVAVVAANFNGHPSTFAVDCSNLAAAFGATTTSDASASVAQLMTASLAYGELVRKRLGGSSSPASAGASGLSITAPLPSLNLKGGVWEVRDIFQSSGDWLTTGVPGRKRSNVPSPLAAAAGVSHLSVPPFDPAQTTLSDADGPLVAILAADEAAYAPMMSTLQPHRSYCWLYVSSSAAGLAASSSQQPMRSPIHGLASPKQGPLAMPNKETETDPAAMQWLFASSLLRLQAMLRLKECGLATAVITPAEVEAAGGYEELLNKREVGAEEPWISPGEMLKDEEIQAAVRHNLVYSLVRNVCKRTYKSILTARRAAAEAGEGPEQAQLRMRDVVAECAELMDAALRVLVTHFRVREGPADPNPTRRGPNLLRAEPLPQLHANIPTSPSSSHNRNPGWYAVDAEAAVATVRAAMFLAVKDVVAQAASATAGPRGGSPNMSPTSAAAAASGAAGPSANDVSDEDATLSALLCRGLVRVARGQITGSVVNGADRNGPDASLLPVEIGVMAFAKRLLWRNHLGPIVFVTPELGKWSTVGGLGVMVDELSVGLAELGAEVVCISPYYNVNRKGVSDYLRQDGITYTGRNVVVWVGGERIEMGVHEGVVHDVRVLFLHNPTVFPRPYPPHDAFHQVRVMSAFARGTLETLCQWRLIPSLIITNDWFTGLVPAYARNPRFFGHVFNRSDFMHICHNLDPDYEGRLWPDRAQGSLGYLHELDPHLLVDPYWADVVINPTRAALLCSDTWATVSRSYRTDLLSSSPLRSLLRLAPHPFAHPNGIPVKARASRLQSLPFNTHEAAKAALQRKYFGMERPDPTLPLFAFVGRITAQKGVHLILQSVDQLLRDFNYRAQFIVGGMASESDSYGRHCAGMLHDLRARHPSLFWADPGLFFTDGDLVNLGADFCLMPSVFEPGGIVQQEFFVAGTPVIAFKTGGLKDTVINWNPATQTGNGFTFETHAAGEFQESVRRAMDVYRNPDLYQRLRSNARASVMDLSVVSLAWFREFHRVRRCLPPAPRRPATSIPVKFSLRVGEVPGCSPSSVIHVAGSFNNWQKNLQLKLVPGTDRFEIVVSLGPGAYGYKYVVDEDVWTTTPEAPVADDGKGHLNNVLNVLAPPTLPGDDD